MLTDSLIAGFFALLAFWLSGARKMAYLLFFLAFIPFISIDPDSGGLRDVSGLGGQNVLFKLSVRLVTSAGLLLLLVRRRHALKFISLPHCWPILFYLMWSLIGLLQRPDPWLSVVRLGELVSFFLIGVSLYLEVDRFHGPRKVARWHCLALLHP